MEAQLQQGLDVRGLCPFTKDIPPALRGPIEQLPVREMDFEAPDFCRAAMESAAGGPPALFHFHGFVPQFQRLGRSLVRAGIPYVITSQGQLHYRDPLHWLKKFVYLNLVTPFFRQAGGLHFVTRRERIRCRYLLPGWRKPALVQHNVIKVPDPDTVSPAPRQQYGIPAQAFTFAYLGRLHIEHKGLDLLVEGFARLPPASNCCLALIGPDWAGGRPLLEGLAQRLNCAARIRFLGPEYGEQKWRLLKMADAFISPSRWDACPSAVGEAIGFGLPTIVSSAMNPAPEYVEGQAALAPEPRPAALARAMQQLAADRPLQQSLSRCGRKWILEHCSHETAGARFKEFYRAFAP
jgi:glycosyltransferase involved in cell wall biosynthesis